MIELKKFEGAPNGYPFATFGCNEPAKLFPWPHLVQPALVDHFLLYLPRLDPPPALMDELVEETLLMPHRLRP
jgi:hypothetical protein